MKTKKLLLVVLLISVFISAGNLFAQVPTGVKFIASNQNQVSANEFRFDIYLKNTGVQFRYLYSSVYLNYNTSIANGGTVTCAYVAGSNMTGHESFIAGGGITSNAFRFYHSAPPSTYYTLNTGDSVRIATLKITTSASSFAVLSPNLVFRTYSGSNPKTKLYYHYDADAAGELTNGAAYTFENQTENLPLPVELASFTASTIRNNVKLTWSTSQEINNKGFDIERKGKDNVWNKVGFIAGNNKASSYTFEDNKLETGKYNYRLKQSDYNGNFKYFNLENAVEVGIPSVYALSQNYPNPFNPNTKIDYDLPFDGKVRIAVYDITGREIMMLVNEVKTAGYYTHELNAGSLSSGTYFYRMIANGNGKDFIFTKKMMLIK